MKTRLAVTALFWALGLFLVSAIAQAYDGRAGTIISPDGGSFNSSTTATPFLIPEGAPMAIQCDVAACVSVGMDSGTAASCSASGDGVAIQGGTPFGPLYDVQMVNPAQNSKLGVDTIAAIPATPGVLNCKVTKLITP